MQNNEEIQNIKQELQAMNKKLDKILELMETDCKKMSDHIDFIEQVYNNVKSPFHFIMNRISGLSTIENPQTVSTIENVNQTSQS